MSGSASSGIRLLGSLGAADGKGVVRVEERYDTDIDDLWTAITDPDRLARWFGRVEGDLRPGGQFRLHVFDAGMDTVGQVVTCEAPQRLVVTNRESDESYQEGNGVPPYDQTIDATLTADRDQTILVIEVRGMPLEAIPFFGTGWQVHAENLAAYLAGRELGDTKPRWDALVPLYQELAAGIE
jgi:uncharacterized protein YndB with AHSA1/START domain